MAAIFISSCYQAEFRFAIEQTGSVRRIERVIFPTEPEADGNLRAVEELAAEGDVLVFRRIHVIAPMTGVRSIRTGTLAAKPMGFLAGDWNGAACAKPMGVTLADGSGGFKLANHGGSVRQP